VGCGPEQRLEGLKIGLYSPLLVSCLVERVCESVRFYDAVVNGAMSHNGDRQLAQHISNCVIRKDARGACLLKSDKNSTRRIDAAVAAVMAHDRACYLADSRKPQLFIFNV